MRRGHRQRPHPGGVLRGQGRQGGLLRVGAQPVRGAVQPPSPGVRRGAGGRLRRPAAGIFSKAAVI